MPENEIPPAMRVDYYFCGFKKEVPLNDNTDYIALVKHLISLEMKIALSKLTTQEADVIILFWYYGYPLDEVAKILHKSYTAVAKQHERIKEKLKTLLSD